MTKEPGPSTECAVSGLAWRRHHCPPAHPDEQVSSCSRLCIKERNPHGCRLPRSSTETQTEREKRTRPMLAASAKPSSWEPGSVASRDSEVGVCWTSKACLGWTRTGPESQDREQRPEEDGEICGCSWVFSMEELMGFSGISCHVRWSPGLGAGARSREDVEALHSWPESVCLRVCACVHVCARVSTCVHARVCGFWSQICPSHSQMHFQ